ncbi:MAG TPA: hypothetical protein DDZ51_21475 [Planctomycetaceae bacterium]|nr:hypothetical protein [Planctomycetaceae bacterium]
MPTSVTAAKSIEAFQDSGTIHRGKAEAGQQVVQACIVKTSLTYRRLRHHDTAQVHRIMVASLANHQWPDGGMIANE